MSGGQRARRSTIYDVAKLAGVSAGTVSHVLNGTASISEETVKRVREAIAELGYSRNENARALRTANSKLIGIVLQDISSEYYAQCTAGILERAREEGYSVITTDAQFSPEILKGAVSALTERCVNGLIFVGGKSDREIYEHAANQGVPIVFGDRFVEGYPCVEFNNYETLYALVHALHADGYTQFYYYGEELSSQQNLEMRFGGFQAAVRDLQIPQENLQVSLQPGLDGYKMRKAYEFFRNVIPKVKNKAKRSIILTSNDMIAQGVISALIHSGLRVPEDVAVFGCDNISISVYSVPSISTIVQEPYDLGVACFNMLLARMRDPKQKIDNIMLRQKVVLRDSARIRPENVLAQNLALYVDSE